MQAAWLLSCALYHFPLLTLAVLTEEEEEEGDMGARTLLGSSDPRLV